MHLQSRGGKPMNRYFPDVVEQIAAVGEQRVVLDGEMVVEVDGVQEFDLLSQRIHPAESRVKMLAEQTPARYVAFDVLAVGDEVLTELGYDERRARLAELDLGTVEESPSVATPEEAGQWLTGNVRGRGGQAGRRALPARRAQGHGQDQAAAHPGRRGGGLPLRQGGGHAGLADPGAVRRRRPAARGGPHLGLQGQGEARAAGQARALHDRRERARASPAAGSPTRTWCGRACAPSWWSRSPTTT